MNIVSVEAFAYALSHLAMWSFIGSAFGAWLGYLFAQFTWHCVWAFLRRSPRWRRFDRAMRSVRS